jgi:hypothetical protein
MTDLMDERVLAAARRWQAEQPPPPAIPFERFDETLPRRPMPWRPVAGAAAAVLVLVGAGLSLTMGGHGSQDGLPADHRTTASGPHLAPQAGPPVPWKNLSATHPGFRHREHGQVVTPYDRVSATGHISGQAHPGDTLVFTAVLESSTDLPLSPCPDFNIAFGTTGHTWSLNCAQVPYRDAAGRPMLPAFTNVRFEMRVTVPDEPGRQKVLWTLDGPHAMPGFYGIVDVTRAGSS